MAREVRRVAYFYTMVRDEPGEGYRLLTRLAELGTNLLAFTAVPIGPTTTQLALFPDDAAKLQAEGIRAGIELDGPHPALLVQGDDVIGALVELHDTLFREGINVFSSMAVASGAGRYGYLMYLRPADVDAAATALAGKAAVA
ncbi:MAG TPA: hypothetical protein VK939_07625 [Longimicrobiales bacterium]|nr:hypothetical protein [Longimicrobiales bacterium]